MNTARVRKQEEVYNYTSTGYAQNPIIQETPVIEGYFRRESMVKEMAIRKVNRSLCALLCISILVSFISYYFSMSNELRLNILSRQITTLNDENAELQNSLDRLKSFNNVDNKMEQYNLLQKPAKVIEVQAVNRSVPENIIPENTKSASFDWSVGY